jgi:hypothetical protein
MYPLEAKSDTRIEQAASTEVMPAAVPSIVFSNIPGKNAQMSREQVWKEDQEIIMTRLSSCLAPS